MEKNIVCMLIFTAGIPTCNKVKESLTGLDRPLRPQEVEGPRFSHSRHMKVIKLSTLLTGHLYPQEIFLVLISLTG